MGHSQSLQAEKENENETDPCNDYLGDKAYLDHMIPHHQVAIDMSNEVMKHTQKPIHQGNSQSYYLATDF
jgi:uncharacterized protein (DUF305 family)